MALYRFSVQQISKKNKTGGSKSMAAVMAYRERSKIGEYDYRDRNDFVCSYTLIPNQFADSEFAKVLENPEQFAVEIEKVEKRKDAQLCDEVTISLQRELTIEENIRILNDFLKEAYGERGQVCRVAIHNPEGNPHAHVIVPQRPLEKALNGGVAFGKKLRDGFIRGKPQNADRLVLMRLRWASIVNEAFAKNKINERITHKSLKEQHRQALAVGDVVKAAETDRPALYLPKSVFNRQSEIISDENGNYDFEANKQGLVFQLKGKDKASLTIETWLAGVNFWKTVRKKKAKFREARQMQKQAIDAIILENMKNATQYAIRVFETRTAALTATIAKLAANVKSITRRDQITDFTNTRITQIKNAFGKLATDSQPNGLNYSTAYTGSSSLQTRNSVINAVKSSSARISNQTIASSTEITLDELNSEMEKRRQLEYTPKRRL